MPNPLGGAIAPRLRRMSAAELPTPPEAVAARFLDGPEATRDLGRAIGAAAVPGALVLVAGEVGAGKTTFAQGLAEGLGVAERATSPTFVLVREHPLPGVEGRPRGFVHVDLYRVTNVADAEQLALDEYLDDGWVVLVEWPDRLPSLTDAPGLDVRLTVVGDGRRADLNGRGAWAEQVAKALGLRAADKSTGERG